MPSFRSVFLTRRMFLMLTMGFASGLPLALTGGTLQAWMKEEGIDLKVIGIFSLVGLPYTLKFLWAPAMDRFVPRFLGRRRGWMLLTQVALIGSIAALGILHPKGNEPTVALIALLVAFFSASQDIVIDAYRTEFLTDKERGPGAAISNLGYRIAMITSGAVALILADRLPWDQVYLIMAAILSIGLASTIGAAEPVLDQPPPKTLKETVIDPFLDYFKKRGSVEILAFIILYKVDIVMASALTTPFLLELGFSKTEIGAVAKGVGLIASILGSLAGGALYIKLGMKGSLWTFGIIQGLSTLSFALLAAVGNNSALMASTVAFENFCAGLATAPFIAFLMSLCNQRYTATHYALLTSFSALARVFAGAPTGYLVEAFGWVNFFWFCALTAIPALVLLRLRFDRWVIIGLKPDS